MLIDCHVHMFSEEELREAGDAPVVAMQRFGRAGAPVRRVEQTVAEMAEAGIDRGVLLPMPTPNLDVKRNNSEIASWVRQHTDRLIGFGSVNVHDNFGAVQEIRRWLRERLEQGADVLIPEIADYEVALELIRAGRTTNLQRLDRLQDSLTYLPLDTPTLRRAAEMWPAARAREPDLPGPEARPGPAQVGRVGQGTPLPGRPSTPGGARCGMRRGPAGAPG